MSPILQTARLQLREWSVGDADAAFEMYGDPEVVRFFGEGWPVPDLAAQRLWLAERIERHRAPEFDGLGAWALVEKGGQQVVGTMLLKPLAPTQDEIEVGWHLARRVWGRGYASEAAREVLRHGFVRLRLDRIYAVTKPENVRSVAVAKRIGMRWLERTTRYYGGDDLDLFGIDRGTFDGAG